MARTTASTSSRRRQRTLSSLACAGLLATLLTATQAPARAAAVEVNLFVASAKEMAGVDRVDELVRIPVVLDESDAVDSADNLVVTDGTSPVVSQATDIDTFPSGLLRGANIYVEADFGADEEKFFTISKVDTPVISTLPDVAITDTATALSVAGESTALTFSKAGTATPGTISGISSDRVDVALSGVASAQASLRFTDVISRDLNDDFENATGGIPTSWTSHAVTGSPAFAWASDRYRNGGHSVSISATGASTQSGLWASSRTPATPGAKYLLEGAIATANIVADPASAIGGARLGVRFYDAAGNFIEEKYSPASTGTKWTPAATATLTAPSNAASLSMIARLGGSGTAWFDLLTLARADAATAPMSGTSATQKNVELTTETGPLFAAVKIVNQQVRAGQPVGGYQIARYLVPQHGDWFAQDTQYRGALETSTHGAEALSVVPLKGTITLGGNGATGDALTPVSIAVGGPALNPDDTKLAVVDAGAGQAMLPVGSSINTIRRVDYSGTALRVVGADFHTGLPNYDMQIYGEQQRHYLRYVFSDDISAENLRQRNAVAANPVVAIVDRVDASFNADLVPLIKQAGDLLLEVPANSRSWSSAALAAYVNGEITGDPAYTATGDSITNGWLRAEKQTVAYWEALFDNGHNVLDADLSSMYYIDYFADDARLWQTAYAAGVGLKNSLDFVDVHGNHQIETLDAGTSITNMVLSGGPSYLWGAMRAGDTAMVDYWTTMFSQPAMNRYVNAVEMPYETVKASTYRKAEELTSPLYFASDASFFYNLEIVSGGTLTFANRSARSGYSAIDIDDEGFGNSSTGWINQDRVHPNFFQRWKFSNHYAVSMKSVLDTATDERTGVTSGARWLQQYLDIAALPVSDERGIHQLPIYTDPEIAAEFNLRNWGDTLPPGNELNNGSGTGNQVRHLVDAYMARVHAADID